MSEERAQRCDLNQRIKDGMWILRRRKRSSGSMRMRIERCYTPCFFCLAHTLFSLSILRISFVHIRIPGVTLSAGQETA